MKGRGMAKPIAVLLIILIAIVAIGIIWVILQGFLREQSEISLAKQQLAQENIDIDDIEGDWSLGSFVNLTLRRGAQEKILINTTVIEKFGDIVFIVDTTGTMGDEIDDVKNTIESFVDKLEEDEVEYQLALVEFKDFPESTCGGTFSGVSDFSERVHEIPPSSGDVFTTEVTEYKKVVESIITGGGADFPESHLAAIDSAITNLNFRSDSEKFIIMLTDAMPHAVDCICPISIYGCVPVTATEGHTSPPCNKGPDSVEVMRDRLEGKFKFYYINKEDIFSTCLNRIMKDDLTPATGGKFYSYTEAEGVNDIILDLADEINKVYAEKISHLKIIFYSDTESEEIQIPSSELPGPLEKRKYELEIAPPIADVKRVEIYSVFVTPSGKQVVGPPLDIINVEGLG